MEYVGFDLGKVNSQICLSTEDGELIEKRLKTEREQKDDENSSEIVEQLKQEVYEKFDKGEPLHRRWSSFFRRKTVFLLLPFLVCNSISNSIGLLYPNLESNLIRV